MIEAIIAVAEWMRHQSLLYDVKKDEPKKPVARQRLIILAAPRTSISSITLRAGRIRS